MCLFNEFDISYPFHWFRLQSWSFSHSGFIQDAQRTHFICRIHLFEHFTNLHVWTENLIDFHRSVIWADNCQILSFISNKTFHFSAFPPSDVQLFALENFRVENYRFRKIAQNVIFGPPDLKMHESASHHFAWTLPAQPRQTWRLQPGNQIQTACRAQTAWPGPTRLTSYRKRWTAISSHFSVAVKTKTWKLAAHTDEAWLWES